MLSGTKGFVQCQLHVPQRNCMSTKTNSVRGLEASQELLEVWEQERWRTSLSLSEPHQLSNLWLFAETEIPGKAVLHCTGISGYGSSERPDLSLSHQQLSQIPFSLLTPFRALQLICHGTERTFTYVYSKANRVCSVAAVARL